VRLHAITPTSGPSRLFAALYVIGVLVALSLVARPDAYFLSRPFIEDAFYSLSVARTLGMGGGISIDGITPTNGVQPLICFLYAPAFAVSGGDVYVALRITVAIEAILAGLAALALGWFATTLVRDDAGREASCVRRDLFWIVSGSVVVSYSLLVHLLNGLETSLAAGFVFASMAFYNERIARRPDAPLAEFARLGALLGIGVLARIDIAILAVSIAAWHLIAGRAMARRTSRLAGAAVIGAVSIAVSLPWWAYNVIVFGHLMPISGLAQKDLLTNRFASLDLVVRGVSNALMLVLHAPGERNGVIAYAGLVLVAAVAALVVAIGPLRRWARAAFGRLQAWVAPGALAPLAGFFAVIIVYYTFFFGAPHFIPRYLISVWLTITVAVLATLYAFWSTAPAAPGRTLFVAIIVVALALSATAESVNFRPAGLHTNVMIYPAEWIATHTSERDRIGMFQSGTTGFLYRRVTNLDGKVNPRALEALRTGTIAELADSANFDYIIDLDFYTRHIFHDARLRARYEPIDTLQFGFVVWRRVR
jgi:hypothetical protein